MLSSHEIAESISYLDPDHVEVEEIIIERNPIHLSVTGQSVLNGLVGALCGAVIIIALISILRE